MLGTLDLLPRGFVARRIVPEDRTGQRRAVKEQAGSGKGESERELVHENPSVLRLRKLHAVEFTR